MNNHYPLQREVWLFDPDPIRGKELGKKIRPGVIISHDLMNKGFSGLVFIVPLTSVCKRIESHVAIEPPEGGLTVKSYAVCEQCRSISKDRLIRRMGKITSKKIIQEIRNWILDLTYLE